MRPEFGKTTPNPKPPTHPAEDHSAKIWELHSHECRGTLAGRDNRCALGELSLEAF